MYCAILQTDVGAYESHILGVGDNKLNIGLLTKANLCLIYYLFFLGSIGKLTDKSLSYKEKVNVGPKIIYLQFYLYLMRNSDLQYTYCRESFEEPFLQNVHL